jgi:hypothetical protein
MAVSVRINLSVPGKMDALLGELSAATGQSKASFVMEALTWYLPRLKALRSELASPARAPIPVPEIEAAQPEPVAVPSEVKLSRKDRRRLEREQRKLEKGTRGKTTSQIG